MFCSNCGEHNETSARFCSNCGHSLLNDPLQNQLNKDSLATPHDKQSSNPSMKEPGDSHFDQQGDLPFTNSGNSQFQQPEQTSFQQPGNGAFNHSERSFQQPNSGSQNPEQHFNQSNNEQFRQPGQPFQQPGGNQFHQTRSQQQFANQRHNKPSSNKSMKVWIISGIAAFIVVILAVSYGLFTIFNGQNSAKLVDDKKVEQIVNNDNKEDEEIENDKDINNGKVDKEKEVVEEKERTQVIKESMPKVFTIITEDGHGSGFLYEKGGYIVTNAHVVAGFSDVLVRNSAGQESPGRVIGISDTLDIALVYSEEYEEAEPLPIENNISDIGIEVIAIGSPQGFENSASIGYLTGTDREMAIEGYNFVYDELYQIDAQIDQGSSGGPLFDATTGKVIGINSLVYLNYQSFAFAIPVYTVSDYFEDWIANPMTASEVVAVDVYAGYETNSSELSEDYSEFWKWYDEYSQEGTDEYLDDEIYNEYLNTYGYYFDEESLSSFITSFFEYYEWSINDADFYWIQDMISPESNAYYDLEQQIIDYSESKTTFDYWYTEILGIDILEDHAVVYTYEEYDLYDANGDYTTYTENVEYYVTIDENGYYLISDIIYTAAE
nr:trypsin-like peptidase domain-containing protein [Lysinibacillus timonensis]